MSFNFAIGIGVRANLDEDTVYQVTKAFLGNLDQVSSDAPWAQAPDVEFATKNIGGMPIHPGAARYDREVGVLE